MFCSKLIYKNPLFPTNSQPQNPPKIPFFYLQCSHNIKKPQKTFIKASVPNTQLLKPIFAPLNEDNKANFQKGKQISQKRLDFSQVGSEEMSILCGLGYWVQGFRGLPWLALNFHMAQNLNLNPSILQLVQSTGTLPMVLKPFYGVISDTVYIGGSRRIPYICIGGFLPNSQWPNQVSIIGGSVMGGAKHVFSWGSLALVPFVGETISTIMASVLLGNLGASITEVAKDALVTEYGQNHQIRGLQSYAFMALATGGLLGNLLGGYFLLRTQNPRFMFMLFTGLLSLQLACSFSTREDSLGLPDKKPVLESDSIRKQFSNLMIAISEDSISRPLIWIVGAISMVPILSGSIFCYQTQCLNLDSSIIGMSKVIGQLTLLSVTLLYDRFWKTVSMRKLVGIVQCSYAFSLMLDLILVKQINLKFGISNEVFALCFSGLAEVVAHFRLLPFQVLFASLAPPGCEGSLTSFLASALCLSSIISGFFGVGLSSLLGITSGDYSNLPIGIAIQCVAALVPLKWIYSLSLSYPKVEKEKKRVVSKRARRYRRVGRVVLDSLYAYRRERIRGK